MATNIFYVEKELGAYITDDYPLIKLIAQIYQLNEHNEKEEKEMNKAKRGL